LYTFLNKTITNDITSISLRKKVNKNYKYELLNYVFIYIFQVLSLLKIIIIRPKQFEKLTPKISSSLQYTDYYLCSMYIKNCKQKNISMFSHNHLECKHMYTFKMVMVLYSILLVLVSYLAFLIYNMCPISVNSLSFFKKITILNLTLP
jgi:hypothetical protein